ncbi:ADP-ribosylation/crystallin J1 [Mesorhizobium muleiense]|uniref:ADP-ribosylation/crystallin J1 n=1 Tax=Mesorhizobium muleiense TaxID=1004279 RepID=UPI0039B0883B
MTSRSAIRLQQSLSFSEHASYLVSVVPEIHHRYDAVMNKRIDTVTLWRPVGPKELKLIEKSGMRAFPPRLPEQPIFYPVLSEAYAVQIARDWNMPANGSGFVTRFEVLKDFLDRYQIEQAGSKALREYWIPAEDLPEFNRAIVGGIKVTAVFGKDANQPTVEE